MITVSLFTPVSVHWLLHLRVMQKTLQLPFFFFCFSFLSLSLDGLAKVVGIFFFYYSFKRLWPGSVLLIWHAVWFQATSSRDWIESIWIEKLNWTESIWDLAFQPLKTLYLHNQNNYDQQTCHGDGLPRDAPTHKVTWRSDHVVLQNQMTN